MDEPQTESRCPECEALMAPFARYCLHCGARRGPLPGHVERLLASLRGGAAGGSPGAAGEPPTPGGPPAPPPPRPPLAAMLLDRTPSPRAVAVAVLAMLGFGVVLGSLGPAAAVTTLVASRPPLNIQVALPHQHAGGGEGGGGGTAQPVTRTIYETAPATPAATSSAPASTTAGTTTTTPSTTTSPSTTPTLPQIKHVFLIVLTGHGFNQTFSPAAIGGTPYFKRTLPAQGELVENFYAVTTGSLANEIALLSGQGPTPQTNADCPQYTAFAQTGTGSYHQALGSGCVLPTTVGTLPAQLTDADDSWKAYVQGIDSGPAGTAKTCRHPALGAADPNAAPSVGDPYLTWRNPVVYFAGLTGRGCDQLDVGLGRLAHDLRSQQSTPSLSYIAADACDDGDDTPCRPGAAAGLPAAATFLRRVVGEIKASAAYRAGGLIAITFDEAPQTGADADESSCCDEPTFPNLPAAPSTTPTTPTATTTPTTTPTPTTTTPTTPTATTTPTTTPTPTTTTPTTPTTPTPTTTTPTTTTPTTTTPTTTTPTTPTSTTPTSSSGSSSSSTGGGGQVGLLLISKYVKPGSVDLFDYYDDFSLLASIEKLFGLPRLGYAADRQLPVFDAALFNGKGP